MKSVACFHCEICVIITNRHRRTGTFPLGGGGGKCLPEFCILARKSNMFRQCIFVTLGGGGGGGGIWRRRILLFRRDCVKETMEGEAVGPFLDLVVLKPGF